MADWRQQKIDADALHYFESLGTNVVPMVREAIECKVDNEVTVNIVVAGASRAGKSFFIRKFLNFPAGDSSAPKFGKRNEHRTTALLSYSRPEAVPGIVMYDAMGIGHGEMKVGADMYCRKLDLKKYDVCILLTSGQFAEDELTLFKHIRTLPHRPPCFLVMSHFEDHAIDEAESYGISVEEGLSSVRIAMKTAVVEKAKLTSVEADQLTIYCIDSRHPDLYDFPLLQNDINRALGEEKRGLAEKRLFQLADESVRQKATSWRKELPLIAIPSGISGLSPIPGTDIAAELAFLIGFTAKFYRDFGLCESRLKELCDTYGLPKSCIASIRAKFKFAKVDVDNLKASLNNKATIIMLLNNFAAKAGTLVAVAGSDDIVKTVPVVGTIIGCTVGAVTGYFSTWYFLKKIIDGCEHDGLVVVNEMRQLLATRQAAPSS